jgi:two-component system, LytTR family, response regulator
VNAPLTVIVVDDEPLARAVVREHLARHVDVTVLAECGNGLEAVEAINERRPELVFLDIQMPGLDGFEVLELLDAPPAVVFVTAFDEHALRAFEVHAVDYLLKPFDEKRFELALERARRRVGADPAVAATTLAAAARGPSRAAPRLVARDAGRVHVVAVDDLDYVAASDDYVTLVAHGREVKKQQTMAEVEAVLDPARFIRIHRSFILNLERLDHVETYAKDSRLAVLKDGRKLPLSRNGYARLRGLLGQL